MTIDDNKEALAMMRKALGSIENRFREAYNKGYHDGLKEGINQTTQKLVDKILEEVKADRKPEPQTEMPRCSVNGTPFDECGFCEFFNCKICKCEADVTQMERSE